MTLSSVPANSIKYFGGASTDTMPTHNVPVYSRFLEQDTGDEYVWDGDSWVSVGNGGAARVRQISDVTGIVEIFSDTGDMTTQDVFTPATADPIKAVEIVFKAHKPADGAAATHVNIGYVGTANNDSDTATKSDMILSGERYLKVFETNQPSAINYTASASDAGAALRVTVVT